MTKQISFVSLSLELVEKLTTIAEECQNIQLKKLKDVCEK